MINTMYSTKCTSSLPASAIVSALASVVANTDCTEFVNRPAGSINSSSQSTAHGIDTCDVDAITDHFGAATDSTVCSDSKNHSPAHSLSVDVQLGMTMTIPL